MTEIVVRGEASGEVLAGEVVAGHRTPDEWAEVVRADLARSVEGIVAAGQHLAEAKATTFANYGHGDWLDWVARELPIGPRAAQHHMQLARHPVIANAIHGSHLPASYRTLAELSRLEPPQLEAAIEAGRVNPDLEQKQARALVAEYRIRETGSGDGATDDRTLVDGEVGTIVADPPWRYGNTSTRGAAQDHYPTMSLDDLCDVEDPGRPGTVVHKHAGRQAHLYLWTTAGHLPQAFDVMEAWGFAYKTYLVWVKPQMGMGNYFRVSTELVLFGVRGELRTQARDLKNYFNEPRGKHSAKPEMFYDMVMKASPGPYLELFARCRKGSQLICGCTRCRLGWQVWGNEA